MKKKNILSAIVFGTVLSSNPASNPAMAQSFDASFSKRVYIGIGAGQSLLEPDTGSVNGLEVADDSDTAGQVVLGFDFSRRLTAELQLADLGAAGLSDGDGIEYSIASINGLFYIWNIFGSTEFLDFDGLDQRAGLSLYGRAGIGRLENEAVRNVQFERGNDTQSVVGLGLEYSLTNGLGVRGEFIYFDTDASYAGLTLLYRFGGGPLAKADRSTPVESESQTQLPTLAAPVETLPPPVLPSAEAPEIVEVNPAPFPAVIAAVIAADTDGDGVVDEIDNCPQTSANTEVDRLGCSLFGGVLEGVNFLPGSDTLTDSSFVGLDEVVNTMLDFTDIRVSVQAHTDNDGSEAENNLLSRNRAISVVRYLVAQGVPIERLEARAFGESQPIADNNTRTGRLLNRRVEFVVIP